MLFTRDGCNGVSICNNGFDWLNSNKHIAVFHTEAYRKAQKVCIFSGTKINFSETKINVSGTKINFSATKNNISGTKIVALKLFLMPQKLFFVPLILLFLVPLKLFLVPLKIQTFEPNGTPYC